MDDTSAIDMGHQPLPFRTDEENRIYTWDTRLRRVVFVVAVLILCVGLLGSSVLPAASQISRSYAAAVSGQGFDLLAWEIEAIGDKLTAAVRQPVAEIPAYEQPELVRKYLMRAREMQQLEGEIQRLYSEAGSVASDGTGSRDGAPFDEVAELQAQLDVLREQQQALRPAVEQVIQNQVGWVLVDEGFAISGRPVPPVQFTFTEPPKKLIVSPRDRIDTVFSRMLDAEISLSEIEDAEAKINQNENSRAYITNIGGLGAFPTMVVDRASLEWVMSTVAHEWVHNYLVFFPLGWNYFASHELTTMNETVAEIVGNEIGARAYSAYYPQPEPELLTDEVPASELETPQDVPIEDVPPPFDFRAEMRETRLEVDRLLAEGKVDEAEAYMEARRQVFVEQGYPLRVLNQAYFAFHGSYGTSAASTSPVGPKMEKLRELMPDVQTFLQTVRDFTSVEDLDAALQEWEAQSAIE